MTLPTHLRGYLTAPRQIGAPVPSSRWLARAITDWGDWSRVRSVVEFGAGTGAMTSAILNAVPADCHVLLIERNARFVDVLRRRFPGVEVIHGRVEDAAACCRADGSPADVVVSSLPWASFSPETQAACLEAAVSILHEQGMFVTFSQVQSLLLTGGRRLARMLPQAFEQVQRTRIVLRCLPPAVVYRCSRPRRRDG